MKTDEIDRILLETLEDRRLSRGEREAMAAVLRPVVADPRSSALARSRAFAIARERLSDQRNREVVDWLEGVVKILLPRSPSDDAPPAEVFFSRRDDCPRKIGSLIAGAKDFIEICVFTLTDDRLARAILTAHQGGVRVRIITDDEKAPDTGSDIERLQAAGIAVRTDRTDSHMHHKFAIFDRSRVLTGSYNWTRGAARDNEENFIVSGDGRLVSAYLEAFEEMWRRFD